MFNDDVNDENIRICCKEIHFGHLIPVKQLNKPYYFPIIFFKCVRHTCRSTS